ncbi:MAG: PEP-CTERM sorting domain-containing protein [Planctomycetota bacterium]
MGKISSVFLAALLAGFASAAFVVEPYDGSLDGTSGRDYDNFTGTPRFSTAQSAAPGLLASHSAYGSTAEHVYVYSYSPQTDGDNWDTPAYQYFGNGAYSTQQPGGQTGYYNVFITWPASENVTATCDLAITHDGGVVEWLSVNMNTGGTVPPGTDYLGANDSWLMIAESVLLTADHTYTVTQTASAPDWVSMRSSGVMWEFVEVPEPLTLLLMGLGGLLLRKRE